MNNNTRGSATEEFKLKVEKKIKDWSFSQSGGVIDVTDSGSGDSREHVPGKRSSTSGSFSAFHLYNETELTVNTEYEAHLMEEDTSGDEVYWSGKIIITDKSFSVAIEGESAVEVSYSFTATGALIKTDSSAT
jgi:hypothetical protein